MKICLKNKPNKENKSKTKRKKIRKKKLPSAGIET